jgi:hypothetical protein
MKPEVGPVYPRLPESSPWAHQEPEEPPINAADLFAVEPCGTLAEQREAEEILRARSAAQPGGSPCLPTGRDAAPEQPEGMDTKSAPARGSTITKRRRISDDPTQKP